MGAEEEGGTAHKQPFILCPFEKRKQWLKL
jgi:hypothetical protein